jgi:hypothetical protein
VLYLRRSERLRISASDYIADSRIRKRTFRDVPKAARSISAAERLHSP